MSESDTRAERYELAHKRSVVVGLAFGVSMCGFFAAWAFDLISERAADWGALILPAAFLVSLLTVRVVTLRGRYWRRRDPVAEDACRDEWMLVNRNRAVWAAFRVVMWAQVPLMFLMTRVAPGRSVVGMAGLTMALGAGAFFASFLYFNRQPSDG
jgi:hypothetical protein